MIASVSTSAPNFHALPLIFIENLFHHRDHRENLELALPCPLCFFVDYFSSSGRPILPSTAEAAATAGLDRYTSLLGCPILPTRFRLVVDMDRSPSARMPMWPPRHGPQVGVLNAAPASMKTSTRPSLMDCLYTACVAGITIM